MLRIARPRCCGSWAAYGTGRVTLYPFPKVHRVPLNTTNRVESSFAAVGVRPDAGRRQKKLASAGDLMWKMWMRGEKKFQRLKSPELLAAVYDGQLFED